MDSTPELPETVEQLLCAMVSFNTVSAPISGNPLAEVELSAYLERFALALGFKTRHFPVPGLSDNVILLHEVDANAPWLLFVSHMDTVSIDNMSISPLTARIAEGKIYGRGSCDTKGSGASMLWALRNYANRESDATNNIALLFSVNEEAGMNGIASFVKTGLPSLHFKPVGAFVGEPTGFSPVVAHNGTLRLTIETRGIAAHSCDPSQGRSAISDMVEVIHHFESIYIPSLQASHPLTGNAQCSINVIRGGTQPNIIPQQCLIQMDRRLVPGESPKEVYAELEDQLVQVRRSVPELKAEASLLYGTLPLAPLADSTFYQTVQECLRHLGLPTDLTGVAFGTEGGYLSDAGIPAVVIGPGNIAQAHTNDEWLSVSALNEAVKFYEQLMLTKYL